MLLACIDIDIGGAVLDAEVASDAPTDDDFTLLANAASCGETDEAEVVRPAPLVAFVQVCMAAKIFAFSRFGTRPNLIASLDIPT